MTAVFRSMSNPGVRLMRRLRLPWKLGLIGLMLFLPLVLLLQSQLASDQASLSRTRAELDTTHVVQRLMASATLLQQQRGLTNRALSSDAGPGPPRSMAAAGSTTRSSTR